MGSAPRRRPRLTRGPLPVYAYIPGQNPHPRRDPAGHGWRLSEPRVQRVDEETWRRCEVYLRGVDLFNERYFWESHEAFEALWRGVDRGPVRELLQALIQAAAAEIKVSSQMAQSAERLAAQALARCGALPDRLLGVDVRQLERDLRCRMLEGGATPIGLIVDSDDEA